MPRQFIMVFLTMILVLLVSPIEAQDYSESTVIGTQDYPESTVIAPQVISSSALLPTTTQVMPAVTTTMAMPAVTTTMAMPAVTTTMAMPAVTTTMISLMATTSSGCGVALYPCSFFLIIVSLLLIL